GAHGPLSMSFRASVKAPLALLFQLAVLVAVIPPGFRNTPEIARSCRGPIEHVPIGDPVRRQIPVRNPIAARTEHTVECPAGYSEFVARLGGDDVADHRVDRRIDNAGMILRAFDRGGLR